MARKVFYSFHYNPDNWRASQVRNIGAIEGNQPAKDNDWETITKGGDKAIEKWIADQMSGRSCVVVLIGAGTANRKWINHEIARAGTTARACWEFTSTTSRTARARRVRKVRTHSITSRSRQVVQSCRRSCRPMTRRAPAARMSTPTSKITWNPGSRRRSRSGRSIEWQ